MPGRSRDDLVGTVVGAPELMETTQNERLYIPRSVIQVDLFPFAWTAIIEEPGSTKWWSPPYALALRGIAAMSECGPEAELRIEVNGRVLAAFSPLHLTHLWPECFCEQRVLGDLTILSPVDSVRWLGPPNTIVVSYWLAKR